MNPWVISAVVAVWIGLRFLKTNALMWLFAVGAGGFVILSFGVVPPVPSSILGMFMAILVVSLLLYGTSEAGRLEEINGLLSRWLTQKRFLPYVAATALILPGWAGFNAYRQASHGIEPPPSGRTIHPAPPGEIDFRGKKIDLINAENPFRELDVKDKAAFSKHVENGRGIYYQNCVFCHGDNMEGDGIYAHGLDPIPANFQDPTTIAMLQESYLFWRISKGGPGLPDEGTPWLTAMPSWETRLSEEEIWDVILFLYDFTGRKPRSREKSE